MSNLIKTLNTNNKNLLKLKKTYFIIFIIYSIFLLLILVGFGVYIYNQKKHSKIVYINTNKTANVNNKCKTKTITKTVKIKPTFTNSILFNNTNKKCVVIPTKKINKLLNNKTIKSWLLNNKYIIYNVKEYKK